MFHGTVKWFNPTKGYEFIQPQGGGNVCTHFRCRVCWIEHAQ